VTGLTSNPTIFDKATRDGTAYGADIAARKASGASDEEVFFELALADLRRAAELFGSVHSRTDTVDGWVSLEVSPMLAHDTPRTVEQAEGLHRRAALDNLFIKIPGTPEGLPAIEECICGVASGSATETFLALRLEIDNWRWADVPIFLRAGKALPHKVTEVRLLLRRTPRLAFLPEPTRAEPNQIVLRIDPDPGLRLQLSALAGQSWRTVHLDTSFARELGEPPEPYEVLLHAAMVGDHQYFAWEDSVEETWRIVQPLLDHPPDLRPYPRGSWGPEGAETLLRGHLRWQQPWLPEEG